MRGLSYNMKSKIIVIFAAISVLIASSCSTTRVLQEGEYRLRKNKIEITNDKDFNPNQLNKYLKQNESLGWSPFLYVYNWSNGKGKAWDRFVHKIGRAPVVYNPELVETSVLNIENHLEYIGYYGSRVNAEIRPKGKTVNVRYNVTLGKRFPISEITMNVPENGEFKAAFMSDTSNFTVKKGDFLAENILEAETERSSKVLRNMGFYDFSKNNYFFEADTISIPGYALLDMTVNEYTRNESPMEAEPLRKFYINDVSISYPKTIQIKDKILRNLNTIIPGDLYDEDDVNNTYSRLSALDVFSSVNIGMNKVDTNLVDCSISLTPSKLQGLKFNFEASTNSSGLFGLSPQISYFHKNIFKGGEWLNLSFMGNSQFKINDDVRSNEFGLSVGLSLPRFFPLPYSFFDMDIPRTDINCSFNYQNRPEYKRNLISTSFGYSGNMNRKYYYQIYPLQLNIVRLFNMDEDFYSTLANDPFLRNAYQDHFDLGSGATFYYTTNTANIPDETYFYSRLQFDIAGNLLSAFNPLMKEDQNGSRIIWNTPYSQYVRGEITLGKTWIWGKKKGQSLATRFLAGAGYAYGNSTAIPFEKHFFGGGSNSLRGWQVRTVGPGTSQRDKSFIIPNQTGDMKLEANIEYRFDIAWKFAGAVFVDAGNIWMLEHKGVDEMESSIFRWKTLGDSIAANWGLGMRLDFGILLVRVDMGMKFHDPAAENKWIGPDKWLKRENYALHFGVGYPF